MWSVVKNLQKISKKLYHVLNLISLSGFGQFHRHLSKLAGIRQFGIEFITGFLIFRWSSWEHISRKFPSSGRYCTNIYPDPDKEVFHRYQQQTKENTIRVTFGLLVRRSHFCIYEMTEITTSTLHYIDITTSTRMTLLILLIT